MTYICRCRSCVVVHHTHTHKGHRSRAPNQYVDLYKQANTMVFVPLPTTTTAYYYYDYDYYYQYSVISRQICIVISIDCSSVVAGPLMTGL